MSKLSDQQVEDSALCKTCRGNGKYATRETVDGETTVVWYFCETCGGTGLNKEDGDVD